jgi:hypothetical protein
MGWAVLVHKVTGGVTVVNDEPDVILRHEAGLPKAGSADEKRARLAEHEAALAANDTTENEGEQ